MPKLLVWTIILAVAVLIGVFTFSRPGNPRKLKPPKVFEGLVTGKEWIPGRSTVVPIVGPNIIFVVPIGHPDGYQLKINGEVVWVSKEEFDGAIIGQKYRIVR